MTNNAIQTVEHEQKHDTSKARMAAVERMQGLTPQERGVEKRLEVLSWIYRWGWSSAQVIHEWLGLQRRGFTTRLEKQGFLQSHVMPYAGGVKGVPDRIYTLTELGVNEVEAYRPPTYIEAYRINLNQQQIRHDLIVQRLAVLGLHDPAAYYSHCYTPAEMTLALGLEDTDKRPDLIFLDDQTGILTAVELELSRKKGREWDQTRIRIAKALNEKKVHTFLIVSNSDAILEQYRRQLRNGVKVQHWTKNAARQWVDLPNDRVTLQGIHLTTQKVSL